MDCFKAKTGVCQVYPISALNVIRILGKSPPYYRIDPRGQESFFAVCPCCENPIQIVGLFKETKEAGRRPYGKHFKGSIPLLADYCEEDYYNCPYSKPQLKTAKGKKRSGTSAVARATLRLLMEQFDRVIYLLSKDMEIYISPATAKDMLQSYVRNEGWLFKDASLHNLPWKFGEAERGLKLFGRRIQPNGVLEQALREKCPEVELIPVSNSNSDTPLLQVRAHNSSFVNLRYLLYNHKVKLDDTGEHIEETIVFRVYRGEAPKIETILEKTIDIRTDYFMNLISSSNAQYRNHTLLQIARETLEEYIKR